ncbi:hypothetical protein F4680DRAFT_447607 [Xylaria scruposa]|nr:hypothetical protein F4680DRAFT_447607 [Xylaria scruposa]
MWPFRTHLLPLWNPVRNAGSSGSIGAGPGFSGVHTKKIEDYRAGYPQYTALLSAHNPYFICRRFDKLRARVLLRKQDKLSALEQNLEEVDQQESCVIFLGKSRIDNNTDRLSLLDKIESALHDYDQFIEKTNRVLSFGSAQPRDIESLQNWLDGTGCLAREETEYLSSRDLMSLAPTADNATMILETWIEAKLIRFCGSFRKYPSYPINTKPKWYDHLVLYTNPVPILQRYFAILDRRPCVLKWNNQDLAVAKPVFWTGGYASSDEMGLPAMQNCVCVSGNTRTLDLSPRISPRPLLPPVASGSSILFGAPTRSLG